MKLIDLHNHTTASDGTLTPGETVEYAAAKGLAAIAVTDHDTASGAAQAVKYAGKYGVEVIPGIEISADYRGYGIHILGYFIDPNAASLERVLDWIVRDRERRNGEIMELMRADGIDVTADMMKERFQSAVIGRPHFAAVLAERGMCADVQEGFDRYLSRGMRYYRRRNFLPLDTALRTIAEAGGKAVFAHPLQYRMDEQELLALTALLREKGCVGMECLYSGYTPGQSSYLKNVALRFGMCVTGGSDFHGKGKPNIDMGTGTGGLKVPYELLEGLREA